VCVIIIISIIIIITIIIIIINKQVLLQRHRVQKTSRALNKRKIKAMTVSCQLEIRLSEIKGQLKSRVFSRRLKEMSDGDYQMAGRPFLWRLRRHGRQRRSDRTGGMCSLSIKAELSQRRQSTSATWRSSCARYGGAMPCRQWKTSTASLNSIRCGTRSQ